jgi:hypothetical protein
MLLQAISCNGKRIRSGTLQRFLDGDNMANVTAINRIISAKDYGGSAKGYIRRWQLQKMREGMPILLRGLDEPPVGPPLQAVVWQGQWIVRTDCCNSASFVDPDEPIFYCFSCANRAWDHRPRPVTFPPEAERLEIERLLLERPVNDVAGLTDMERAGMARPVLYVEREEDEVVFAETPGEILSLLAEGRPPVETRKVIRTYPLVRSWEGEPVEQLRAEQETVIQNWRNKLSEAT